MKYDYILIASVVIVKIVAAILTEVKLPNKDKTLRFNLNCRRNVYTIGWIVDCLLFTILLNFMPESNTLLSNSNYYFLLMSSIAIGLFIILYLIDRKLVVKYKTYILDNIGEYYKYTKNDINGIHWTSFSYAIMNTLFAMLPISILLS